MKIKHNYFIKIIMGFRECSKSLPFFKSFICMGI
jgi:hypothetical protein